MEEGVTKDGGKISSMVGMCLVFVVMVTQAPTFIKYILSMINL